MDIIKKSLFKFKSEIEIAPLTIENLNDLEDCNILILSANITRNGITIESEDLSADHLDLKSFSENIYFEPDIIIIFTENLPTTQQLEGYTQPTLFIEYDGDNHINNKKLNGLYNHLIIKLNLNFFKNSVQHNLNINKTFNFKKTTKPINIKTSYLDIKISKSSINDFIGRENDITSIINLLHKIKDKSSLLTIKGSGGIGKTAIVKKIAIELSHRNVFHDGIFLIDCEPIKNLSIFTSKLSIIFGVQDSEDLIKDINNIKYNKSIMIILDNFESISCNENAQDFYELLSYIVDYSCIVITSRELLNVSFERPFSLRTLDPNEAMLIFENASKNKFIKSTTKQKIKLIEHYLDYNPLAINIMSKCIPSGKCLDILMKELDSNFFDIISEAEISIFNDTEDKNISRKKSIYISVKYSYDTLSESEKDALICLSLFPDGINTNSLNANSKNNVSIVGNRELTSLENKSLIENNNGVIRLHSIINRFSNFKLNHSEHERYTRFAYEYNINYIRSLRDNDTEYSIALKYTLEITNNLIKTILISKHFIKDDPNFFFDYIYTLLRTFSSTYNLHDVLKAIKSIYDDIINILKDEHQILCFKLLYYSFDYFSGNFLYVERKFNTLIPHNKINNMTSECSSKITSDIIESSALNIHSMMGNNISTLKYHIKHSSYKNKTEIAASDAILLGYVNTDMLKFSEISYKYLEGLFILNDTNVELINEYISSLNINQHLDRIQSSYCRSRIEPYPIDYVDTLISINPYTEALKLLILSHSYEAEDMFGFSEKISNNYEVAIKNLTYIRYYFVQAIYYYCSFLKKTNNYSKYLHYYEIGINLCKKNSYSFWIYKFESLENIEEGNYNIDSSLYFLNNEEKASLERLINKRMLYQKKYTHRK